MRGTWASWRRYVAAVLVLLCVTSCGEQVATRAYDPPRRFAEDGERVEVDSSGSELSAVLYDKLLYAYAGTQVRAIDVTSGATVWQYSSRRASAVASDPRAPALVRAGGRSLVVVAFAGEREGSGTQKDRSEVDVEALDAHTGERVWRTTLRPPPVDESSPPPEAEVVGADGDVAVVGYGEHTYAVDMDDHDVAWHEKDLVAHAVTGGMVVGTRTRGDYAQARTVAAVDASSGTVRWTHPHGWYSERIAVAAPGVVALAGSDYDTGERRFLLLRARSGRQLDSSGYGVLGSGPPCRYDGESVTVCSGVTTDDVEPVLFAYDSESGERLWTATGTAERALPTVHAVFHGVVYGQLDGEQRRVLLRARTGKDLAGDPGVVPSLVSRFGAVTVSSEGDAAVHRATG